MSIDLGNAPVGDPPSAGEKLQIRTSIGAAALASPAFTGTPTAPTPSASDDSTKLATTEFVNDWSDANNVLFLSSTSANVQASDNAAGGLTLKSLSGGYLGQIYVTSGGVTVINSQSNNLYFSTGGNLRAYVGNTGLAVPTFSTMSFGNNGEGSISFDNTNLVINPRVSGSGNFVMTSGSLSVGNSSPAARLHVTPSSSANVGLLVRGVASQSANLIEVQSSTGTSGFTVSSSGYVTCNTLQANGTAIFGDFVDFENGAAFNNTAYFNSGAEFSSQVEMLSQAPSSGTSAMTRELACLETLWNMHRVIHLPYYSSGGMAGGGSQGAHQVMGVAVSAGTTNGTYSRALMGPQTNFDPTTTGGVMSAGQRMSFAVFGEFVTNAAANGAKLRFLVGVAGAPPLADANALSSAGFGVEIMWSVANSREEIRLVRYNGSFAASAWAPFRSGFNRRTGFILEHVGNGTLNLYVSENNALNLGAARPGSSPVLTLTGGPTGALGGGYVAFDAVAASAASAPTSATDCRLKVRDAIMLTY